MLGGHLPELLLLLIVALIFFGPKRLPEMGSALGKSITSFKQGLSHIHNEVPAVAEITNMQGAEPVAARPVEEPIPVDLAPRETSAPRAS